MNIGDKVRLVHGREEGIVYAFLPGNVVEVEIEDGFRIPVLRNEIVTISPVESQRLEQNSGRTNHCTATRKNCSASGCVFRKRNLYRFCFHK